RSFLLVAAAAASPSSLPEREVCSMCGQQLAHRLAASSCKEQAVRASSFALRRPATGASVISDGGFALVGPHFSGSGDREEAFNGEYKNSNNTIPSCCCCFDNSAHG